MYNDGLAYVPPNEPDGEPDEPEDEREDCEMCNGAGWVDDPSDGGTMTCPDCDGDGKL